VLTVATHELVHQTVHLSARDARPQITSTGTQLRHKEKRQLLEIAARVLEKTMYLKEFAKR